MGPPFGFSEICILRLFSQPFKLYTFKRSRYDMELEHITVNDSRKIFIISSYCSLFESILEGLGPKLKVSGR